MDAQVGETAKLGWIHLPERAFNPVTRILRRIGYAIVVIAAVTLLVMLDKDGYRDTADSSLGWIDAVYYATVTLSTTGYGDIVPVSEGARIVNTLIITPLRVAFLALLVGTTLQVLARGYHEQRLRTRWRDTVSGHTVVIGYGTKGTNAVGQLRATGLDPATIVVIDHRGEAVKAANRAGYVAVAGDATRAAVLQEAGVASAERVIIAANRDDTAVLATLTVRQLNPRCVVVASIRESENEPLLLRSGATSVITSSEAAGRLLGVAATSKAVGEVFTDLLVHGDGLELAERDALPAELGKAPGGGSEPVIAVLRDGRALTYREVDRLLPGDRVVVVGCKPRLTKLET